VSINLSQLLHNTASEVSGLLLSGDANVLLQTTSTPVTVSDYPVMWSKQAFTIEMYWRHVIHLCGFIHLSDIH